MECSTGDVYTCRECREYVHCTLQYRGKLFKSIDAHCKPLTRGLDGRISRSPIVSRRFIGEGVQRDHILLNPRVRILKKSLDPTGA